MLAVTSEFTRAAMMCLVPATPDDPAVPADLAAWEVLERWTKPVLTLWAPGGSVTECGPWGAVCASASRY